MGVTAQPFVSFGPRDRFRFGHLARRFSPSLWDIFFFALMCWLFLAGPYGWLGLLGDGDTGWHIRTGEYILDHGTVPATDLFSFSKPGAPWFAWEWLSDVLLALLHRWAGLKAVVLAAGVVIAGALALVLKFALSRGANPMVAVPLCLLGTGASTIHQLARPHILTILLMAVSVWLLSRDREQPTAWVWTLVPLTAVWTNLHGGFVAFPVTVGLLVAGRAIEAAIDGAGWRGIWMSLRRPAALAAACALATLANPFGIGLHKHILGYLKADWIRRSVQEFQSPAFRDENMLQFEVLLFAGIAAAVLLASRKRVVEALWIGFWAHSSLTSARHIPLFVVVAVPIIAEEATRVWYAWSRNAGRKSVLSIFRTIGEDIRPAFRRMTPWAAMPIVVLALMDRPLHWPKDFVAEKFPLAAVARYQKELAGGRVLTTDQWADYLIYRNYPQQRVFFDGRSDFYGEKLANEYLRALQGHYSWKQFLEQHRFDYVLLPPYTPVVSLLKQDPGWSVMYDDGEAVLLAPAGGTSAGH